MYRHLLKPALAVLALLAFPAADAVAGPPWISVELPANPHDPATRGAFFILRTYHHGIPTSYVPTGTAEGLVDGRRRSVRLEISRTGTPGVFAVRYTPAGRGAWVLAINGTVPGERNAFGVLVTLNREGQVASVRVPSHTVENGRWTIPEGITSEDIEAALRSQVAVDRPDGHGGLATLALLVGGLGIVVFRRTRR